MVEVGDSLARRLAFEPCRRDRFLAHGPCRLAEWPASHLRCPKGVRAFFQGSNAFCYMASLEFNLKRDVTRRAKTSRHGTAATTMTITTARNAAAPLA